MGFYFSRFENRKPPEPLETPRVVKILWQIMSVAALVLGANYIRWRWMESLNMDALWYALPLVIAETCAWIGTVLFTINLWREDDPPQQPAPLDINDCLNAEDQAEPRPVRVDLFIATYSEDVELVRLSIQDALKMRYPGPLDYRIHVLDDGRRPAMRAVCEEEGVNWRAVSGMKSMARQAINCGGLTPARRAVRSRMRWRISTACWCPMIPATRAVPASITMW